jgi:hypothetical protein
LKKKIIKLVENVLCDPLKEMFGTHLNSNLLGLALFKSIKVHTWFIFLKKEICKTCGNHLISKSLGLGLLKKQNHFIVLKKKVNKTC